MRTVGILNTKGGTGKTTLTLCLAVRAAQDQAVGVVDLDPQGSYSEWYALRGSPENPMLLRGADRASEAVEALRLTSPYEFVFFDGPPGSLLVTEDAVRAASLVIMPIKASGLDLGASRDCIQLCQEIGTPLLAVINDVSPHGSNLADNARALLASWKVRVAKTVIKHRTQYINAITKGKTGPERDKAARSEIDALWQEILKALKTAKVAA